MSGVHSPAYRADIDGLRCIAVVAVVAFHAFPGHFGGGFVGVDIFFVISGFLITTILLREARAGRFSILRFYGRRIRRLFPALLAMLVAVLAVGWCTLVAYFYRGLAREVLSGASFLANLYYLDTASYFSPFKLDKPLLHLWSLGVEEQFYFAWPLLVFALVRWNRDVGRWLIGVALVSFATCAWLTLHDFNQAFYSPVSRCWELALGGIVAALGGGGASGRAATMLSLAGGAALVAGFALVSERTAFPALGGLPPVFGTAAIIAAGRDAPVNRLIATRPAAAIGLVSYPLYLWHWPILSFAFFANDLALPPSAALRAGLMLGALALAVATHLVIERPLRRLHPLVLIGGMVAVAAVAVLIFLSGGVPGRAIERDPRREFVGAYAKLHQTGLGAAYREECDFLRWGTLAPRPGIATACTRPGLHGTDLLWGDSHAQALSLGLRAVSPPGSLAQVATSGCLPAAPAAEPALFAGDDNLARACRASNRAALAAVGRLHPGIVYLAQAAGHADTDWDGLAALLRRRGAARVVLIGPVPQWQPSLPTLLASEWRNLPERTRRGLDPAVLALDLALRRRQFRNLDYVSLVAALCNADGCRARAGDGLIAVDYGHLSPAGSLFVGRIVAERLGLPVPRP